MFTRFLYVLVLSVAAFAQTTVTADNSKSTPPAEPAAKSAAADPLVSANALLKSRKFTDAAAAFKAIIEKDPASASAHAGLMRSFLRSRQFHEAQEAGKKAIQAVPSSALVHATFGDVSFRIGEMSDAENEYKAALKLDSNSARGLYGMAKLYHMLSMYKHAKDAVAKAHELDPSDREITQTWLETLPRVERYEAYKKSLGKQDAGETSAAMPDDDEDELPDVAKMLKAMSEKKPWVVVGGVRPVQLKMEPYGRELAAVDISKANQGGAMARAKGFSLQARFNDHVGTTLLLDTGASGILIGSKLAEKAGAVKIADTAFRGVGEGSTKAYYAWIDKVKIGDLEFKDCIVAVSSKKDISDEAGLIGTDVFDEFLITLDFREHKLNLAPLPKNPVATGAEGEALDRYIAPEMQSFTRIYRFGHDLVAPATLGTAKKNATGLFILDTGASINTISVDLARKVTNVSYEEGSIKGVSGKVIQLSSGDQVFLHFAGVHVKSNDILAFDHKTVGGSTEIAGLIGITTLVQMKMTIDYRDGLIMLEPYEVKKL